MLRQRCHKGQVAAPVKGTGPGAWELPLSQSKAMAGPRMALGLGEACVARALGGGRSGCCWKAESTISRVIAWDGVPGMTPRLQCVALPNGSFSLFLSGPLTGLPASGGRGTGACFI